MQAYNHCAVSLVKGKVSVAFGSGAYPSEAAARQTVAENFYDANKHYPHEIQIIPLATELLQKMINASEGDD